MFLHTTNPPQISITIKIVTQHVTSDEIKKHVLSLPVMTIIMFFKSLMTTSSEPIIKPDITAIKKIISRH